MESFCEALRGVVQAILQRQQGQEVLKKWRELEGKMLCAEVEEEDVLCACLSSGDTGKAFEERPLLEFLLQEASEEVLKPLLMEVGERRLQALSQNMKWTMLKTIVGRLHEDSFYGMARRLLLLWRGLGFDEDCKELLAAKQQKHSICVPSLLFFEKQRRNGLARDKEEEEKQEIGKEKNTESLLLGLPIELLSMLCFDGYLDGASLLQLEQTCSFFNSFIANDDHTWRSSYMRRFPDMPCLNSFSVPDSNEELSAIFFSSKYQWQRVLLQIYLYPWRKLYLWREHNNARSNPQDERCLASAEEEWFLNAVRYAPGQPQLTVQLLEQYIKPLPLRWTLAAAKQNTELSSSSSSSFADFWQRMLESPPCNLKCALRIDPADEYFKRDPALLRLLEERLETYPMRLCGAEGKERMAAKREEEATRSTKRQIVWFSGDWDSALVAVSLSNQTLLRLTWTWCCGPPIVYLHLFNAQLSPPSGRHAQTPGAVLGHSWLAPEAQQPLASSPKIARSTPLGKKRPRPIRPRCGFDRFSTCLRGICLHECAIGRPSNELAPH
ncbi:hypothetical protein QOT17_001519 [Balamuthia mandrillaris]